MSLMAKSGTVSFAVSLRGKKTGSNEAALLTCWHVWAVAFAVASGWSIALLLTIRVVIAVTESYWSCWCCFRLGLMVWYGYLLTRIDAKSLVSHFWWLSLPEPMYFCRLWSYLDWVTVRNVCIAYYAHGVLVSNPLSTINVHALCEQSKFSEHKPRRRVRWSVSLYWPVCQSPHQIYPGRRS